jgi:hypothetical protein
MQKKNNGVDLPAKFCIYNMPAENRAHRKNANIIKFVQLFQKAQNMALSI